MSPRERSGARGDPASEREGSPRGEPLGVINDTAGHSHMFESLSDRLQGVFRSLRGEARLTETTVEAALREIRMALLEADVNFKVVKAFIDRVRDRAVDQEVLKSLTPAQQVVRIVRDEMLALFGDTTGGLPGPFTPRWVLRITGTG